MIEVNLYPLHEAVRKLRDESGCGLVEAKRQLLRENMRKVLDECIPQTATEVALLSILRAALREGML